ncbi:hypothetical protein LPJ78_001527 [Coemansia sp. RSA 989]|nr:hypothetical protein BX667DRAFT_517192 [Coemansia mojavensis]KAJ1739958.1 hypothetical protein LPJ68_004219 [Coemansia sp. RSA 1086]KAJ1748402.1 hypothetical protein LPJ79_004560 [Coemansia sp. RSA 1821]KAJ1866792.1 hypothetical protein LPJ78_001527 [Coemansia sp. RSA 989]KAJ1872995.1 hypothetical protein LPJ55_002632 [Coemansia sp. RSA 990]KAJ2646386.1 hypothetical protein IWW40_005456 [Coemansia sp. RSA 1250]KAJ2672439.1 hypothetical protein IWW42_002804 [Coemansia sp. RSA 1085]
MNAGVLGESNAQKRILWGTFGMGATGALVGLNLAILKNLQPIARHTLTMSANWTLYGLLFLSTRELLLAEQHAKPHRTRSADQLFSSTCAGALTGSSLAFVRRRTKAAAASGALFFGAVSLAGQWLLIKVNQKRQQLIMQKMGIGIAREEEDRSSSWAARFRRFVWKDPVLLLPGWFPLRRISSDEYRSILLNRREELVYEKRELRNAIEGMDRREQELLESLQH